MPLPLLLIVPAVAAALYGGKKTYDAVSDVKEKNRVNDQAQALYNRELSSLESKRRFGKNALENLGKLKMEIYRDSIIPFKDTFEKLKNVDFREIPEFEDYSIKLDKNDIADLKEVPLEFLQMLPGGIAALGSGGLAGLATYGAIGTLGTASTGTAIYGLTGIAAKNATLAWLGGGSLAMGGTGVLGGMAVLGGIVAAPVLAVGGMVFASKARAAKEDAYSNLEKAKLAAAQMKQAGTSVDLIVNSIKELGAVLKKLNTTFEPLLTGLESLVETNSDYRTYSEKDKVGVFWTAATAKTLKNLLETKVLDEDGLVAAELGEAVNNSDSFLSKIPQ